MSRSILFLWLVMGAALRISAQTSGTTVIAGIDHIPVAVRNLDSAAARFKALGFALKPGRAHANGIRNMHVKFADGTELELITATDARDELTTIYRKHLAEGEGPAFLALYTPDKIALVQLLQRSGLAFDTADGFPSMATNGPLPYLFFGSGNQSPTDKPEHFAHANGAESVTGVWLATADTTPLQRLLRMAGVVIKQQSSCVPSQQAVTKATLSKGEILWLPVSRQVVPGHPIVGATLRVKSLEKATAVLKQHQIKVPAVVRCGNTRSLFVPPAVTGGLWLEFRETGTK